MRLERGACVAVAAMLVAGPNMAQTDVDSDVETPLDATSSGVDVAAPEGSTAPSEVPPEPGRPRDAVVLLTMASQPTSQRWLGAERRLAAEIAALGMSVIVEESQTIGSGDEQEALLSAARSANALAAVRIVRDGESARVELWLAEPGEFRVLEVEPKNMRRRDGGLLTVLAVVEMVHDSRLEIRVPAATLPPREDRLKLRPPPPRPIPVPPESEVDRWSVAAGFGATMIRGGAANGTFSLRGAFRPVDWLVTELYADLMPFALRVGAADVRHGSVRVQLFAEPWPELRVSPAIGVGAGTLFYDPADDFPGVVEGSVAARVALRVAQHWRVLAEMAVGSAPLSVRLDDGVESLAQPMLAPSGSLEVGW